MQSLKEKNIFVNEQGVGKVLTPFKSKKVSKDDIEKVFEKIRKNDKNRGKTT